MEVDEDANGEGSGRSISNTCKAGQRIKYSFVVFGEFGV